MALVLALSSPLRHKLAGKVSPDERYDIGETTFDEFFMA